ncbi:MAG: hypothetical protein B7Z80_24055 [Rhodospirillales bacterium 20-64-7]|nr:MAG: hypothetical protein B7Z80_24055 [Rhodospirillales bacterium 20-64-7]
MPALMILGGNIRFAGGIAIVIPLLVFLAGQLALFFISVMVGSDESPELGASAPVSALFLRRTALTAGGYCTLLLMAVPVLGVMLRAPGTLPVLIPAMAGALVSNLVIGHGMPIPLMRPDFGKAQKGTMLGLVVGVGVSSFWALLAWVLVTPNPFGWLKG